MQRELAFEGLGEVMPEVDRLRLGHKVNGDWSLGQILFHLATSIRMTSKYDGPVVEESPRAVARRRQFFETGKVGSRLAVPTPELVPPEHCDEGTEAEALRTAIKGYEASDGPFPTHPRFGAMSKAEWTIFHEVHCAHHLSFVEPAPAVTSS